MMGRKSFWKEFSDVVQKQALLAYLVIYCIAAVLLTRAFFERWDVSLLLLVCGLPVFIRKSRRYLAACRQTRAETEFYRMLRQVSMSLSAGATLENAVRETAFADRKDYKVIGGELERVYRMLKNHYPPEYAFRIFAQRCGNREILAFSEVLSAGIPAGINLAQLIRYLSSTFRLKADVEQEIRKLLNAPKYNNRIIMIMPVVCIFLFRKVAPSYLEPLYHGTGRIIMVIVFILLFAAWWIGDRLSDIRY
ncbi:MAG: type II secretion system F family protein [Clostridia bacterium]